MINMDTSIQNAYTKNSVWRLSAKKTQGNDNLLRFGMDSLPNEGP